MTAFSRMSIAACVLASSALSAQTPRLTIVPLHPKPGSIVRLELSVPAAPGDSVAGISGSMAGEPVHFVRAGPGIWRAIGAFPVDGSSAVVAEIVTRLSAGKTDTLRTSVTPPPAVATRARATPRRLAVDQRFTRPLDSATQARIDRENELAREIGRRAHASPPLWTRSFLRPRESRITSRFGSGRVFNGRTSSRHLGVDFSGAVGASVVAANRGIVALVENFFLAGNVIYVDHGGGVVTGYFHLSRPLVATGDTVERGQRIGLVGATGRVTGPHLHWSARYGALTVDPLGLVALGRGWYGEAP